MMPPATGDAATVIPASGFVVTELTIVPVTVALAGARSIVPRDRISPAVSGKDAVVWLVYPLLAIVTE